MKDFDFVSKATIDRMPLYYRALNSVEYEGKEIISSEELGQRIGITPEQIRKDLSSFGEFGKKGVGYYVGELKKNIGEILGLDTKWRIVIVGVGHLGWALAHYSNFVKMGFEIRGLFDIDPQRVGQIVSGVEIYPLEVLSDIICREKVDIGVIAVPADSAKIVAEQLVQAGISGIWNFAPVRLTVPSDVSLINEDLTGGLICLSYYMNRHRSK